MPLNISENISPTQIDEFHFLQNEGKKLAAEGRLLESLQKFELAKKICETPKVLSRIEKLKACLQGIASKSKSSSTGSPGVSDSANCALKNSSYEAGNIPDFKKHDSSDTFKTPKLCTDAKNVLHDVQNLEYFSVRTKTNSTDKAEMNAADQAKFNQLKKTAMDLSFNGKFEESLKVFNEALALYSCPKVKKYIAHIESMLSSHSKKLKEFETLTELGEKLALQGRPKESLQKFKDAFAVCPSPRISKKIKALEGKTNLGLDVRNRETPVRKLENAVHSEDFPNNEKSDYKTHDSSIKKRESSANNTASYSRSNDDSSIAKVTDPSLLSPEKVQEYKSLYQKAREHASDGKLRDALKFLNKAKNICETEKVLKRIKEIEEHIKRSETDSDEDDEKMVEVAQGFKVYHSIYQKLYPYQREGVAWMWQLYNKHKGGVLGDDMGLGKTFQVIAFLSGMIDADLIKHVLIIMPVGLLTNWENEFKKWCPGIMVHCFHGGSKKERERSLSKVQRRGHVLLTSYGMVVSNVPLLTELDGARFVWDYVILDEGHKIKNPTKTTKAVHDLPSRNRLVLTGTPIQNNLRELWALYDFAHQSTLLGSLKTFKMQYENIITRSREKDATAGEKRMGTEMAENLKQLIKPYFLRRTKAEVWGTSNSNPVNELNEQLENLRLDVRKNDFIVWLYMSDPQIEIYQSFLHSDAVKSILVSKRSPLVELTTLKKICDHPRLLSQRACHQLGLNGSLREEDLLEDDESTNSSSIQNVSDETLMHESGKLKFLINLLQNLRENGHRMLVFSLSRKILDMIHRILTNRQWKVMRIDGTISKMEERERRIQVFQKDTSYPVFLLTTQVGGVGLTLTAADRVIIYDPSWNPATDAQAVDRIYRIGQKKDVVVYRLITCGSVEEKIYRRQIFKDSITRQTTCSAPDPYRYFSKQELRELFSLENPKYSATQVQLEKMHSAERVASASLDAHIAYLYSLDIFGLSDHDLMFSKNIKDHDEDNDERAISHDYIKKQVAIAQQLIQAEASVVEQGLKLAGSFAKPFSEPVRSFKKPSVKDFYKPPEIVDITADDPQGDNFESPKSATTTENATKAFQSYAGNQKDDEAIPSYSPDSSQAPEIIDITDDNLESSKCARAAEKLSKTLQSYSPPKKHRNSINRTSETPEQPASKRNKITNYYSLLDEKHKTSSTKSARKLLYSPNRSNITSKSCQSPYFQRKFDFPTADDNADAADIQWNTSSLHPQTEESSSMMSKTSECATVINAAGDEHYVKKEADTNISKIFSSSSRLSGSNAFNELGTNASEASIYNSVEDLAVKSCNKVTDNLDSNLEPNFDCAAVPGGLENGTKDNDFVEDAVEGNFCSRNSHESYPDRTSSPIPAKCVMDSSISRKLDFPVELGVDFADLDFENEPPQTTSRRKSCARRTILLSDSESSQQSSCPSSANTSSNKLIEYTDSEEDSIEGDSFNRTTNTEMNSSKSVIPESAPNSPSNEDEFSLEKIGSASCSIKIPAKERSCDEEYLGVVSSIKNEYTAKRITPLRVDQYEFKPNDSFSKALAASPLIDFANQNNSAVHSLPENRGSSGETIKNESWEDSPVQVQKKKRNVIYSDSEDSESDDSESDAKNETDSVFAHSSDSDDLSSEDADESRNMFSNGEL